MIDVQIPEPFEFLFTPSRYKVAYGGRGAGKSRSFSTALVIKATQNKEMILCTREFQRSVKYSVKKLLDNDIDRMGLRDFFTSTKTEITGKNGSLFFFDGLRYNPEGIQSTEGVTICWVEQAETISRHSLKLLLPTLRDEVSELWFSYNPNNKDDPIHDMFVTNTRDDAIVKKINYYDNPFFPEVLKKELEYDKAHDYDKYLHVWEGETVKHSEAAVFSGKWRRDTFEADENETFYYGADWGFSRDPSVLVRCFMDRKTRTLFVDYESYGVGVEIDELPELFDHVPGAREWKIVADSSRPDTISYMNRHGFKIRGAKQGPRSIVEGVNFLKSYTIVVHERCKHTIDELKTYSYKVDRLTGEILPILVDKQNHIIDPLRYALEGVRRSKKVLI